MTKNNKRQQEMITDNTEKATTLFWDNVKDRLKDRHENIKDFSSRLGQSPYTVTTWITRNKIPTVFQALNIAQALDVSLDTLLGFEHKHEHETLIDVSGKLRNILIQIDSLAYC